MISRRTLLFTLACVGLLWNRSDAIAADAQMSGADDPDFKLQGEYAGTVKTAEEKGDGFPMGVQVIALGDGKFRATAYVGGLPGAGWKGGERREVDGALVDGVLKLNAGLAGRARSEIKDGVLRITLPNDQIAGDSKKLERKSPTLAANPPAGAIVLFDGKSAEKFSPGNLTPDGSLAAGATSKQKFQSCQLHVEFLLPFMPEARGQGRGNSGCYLQGRYEVQMLDSFGLKGEDGECGGIYGIKAPDVNMCLPPLAWQTFDIDYTAAKFDGDKKVHDATMTVKHNGVVVHKDVPLPHGTTAAPVPEGPAPGPIYLQDHGNPVRYRNVWIVEKP